MNRSIINSMYIMIVFSVILNAIIPEEKIEIDYNSMTSNSLVAVELFEEKYDKFLKENYFNNESKEVIAKKINRYLNSSLKNKGEYIVNRCIQKGVDPYLVAAVILHETGCQWKCSYLSRVCYNFGGNKGKPSCNGGSYRKFNSAEEGLNFAIDKLARYYNKGLTTPEEINKSYATSKTWATKINKYIKKLKA